VVAESVQGDVDVEGGEALLAHVRPRRTRRSGGLGRVRARHEHEAGVFMGRVALTVIVHGAVIQRDRRLRGLRDGDRPTDARPRCRRRMNSDRDREAARGDSSDPPGPAVSRTTMPDRAPMLS
jgi:hypothetical protein